MVEGSVVEGLEKVDKVLGRLALQKLLQVSLRVDLVLGDLELVVCTQWRVHERHDLYLTWSLWSCLCHRLCKMKMKKKKKVAFCLFCCDQPCDQRVNKEKERTRKENREGLMMGIIPSFVSSLAAQRKLLSCSKCG